MYWLLYGLAWLAVRIFTCFRSLLLILITLRRINSAHGKQNIVDRSFPLQLRRRKLIIAVLKGRHIILWLDNIPLAAISRNAGNDLPHTVRQLLLELNGIIGSRLGLSFVFLLGFHRLVGCRLLNCLTRCRLDILRLFPSIQDVFDLLHRNRLGRADTGRCISPGIVWNAVIRLGCMLADRLGKLLLGLGNNVISDRVRLRSRYLIYNNFLQLRNGCLHPILHRRQILFLVVIDRLLYWSKGSDGFLELQRFDHIRPLPEPENQVITVLHTFFLIACLVVQLCQLISPLFGIFNFLVFLQDRDLVFQGRTPSLIDLVFQYVT